MNNPKLRPLDKYLNEIIDYGGVPSMRAEAIQDMQSRGIDQSCIDRWLQGNERAQQLRERRERISVRLLASGPTSRSEM